VAIVAQSLVALQSVVAAAVALQLELATLVVV